MSIRSALRVAAIQLRQHLSLSRSTRSRRFLDSVFQIQHGKDPNGGLMKWVILGMCNVGRGGMQGFKRDTSTSQTNLSTLQRREGVDSKKMLARVDEL